MSQTHLFSFEEICKDTQHIYNLLFTLNGAAAVSLVTLAISYDKNNILKGFEFLSGNIFWFIISLFASLVFIMIPTVYKHSYGQEITVYILIFLFIKLIKKLFSLS